MIQGFAFLQYKRSLGFLILAAALLAILVGLLILGGLVTRFATVVVALGAGASMFSKLPVPRIGLFETRMTAALGVLIAAAIFSLGPGAFSVDSRLFGRREVTIPQNPHDAGT